MHTRLFGITYLHVALPPEALAGGPGPLAAALSDPSARRAMSGYESLLSAGGASWDAIVLLDNPVWPQYARTDIAAIARERGVEPIEAVYDLLLGAVDDTRRLMVILHTYDEELQRQAFSHPLCLPGSDATTLAPEGPLAASMFHGAYTWAAWYFRFMVRESGLLSAPEAVRRLSALPAERLGLVDRGVLQAGAYADVTVLRPLAFEERGTTFEPNQLAAGVEHVLVNGVPTLAHGELTGERAGRVLRRS
jgi:N-acyl-D-aspartate/D-glutamate deacylase